MIYLHSLAVSSDACDEAKIYIYVFKILTSIRPICFPRAQRLRLFSWTSPSMGYRTRRIWSYRQECQIPVCVSLVRYDHILLNRIS